ncbi:MAG: bifunctional UDP-N-acetylglucosamine diphosphorylase/glucosamine-1-phosphate N-acetyltransferase GlmU [Desulfohalobium sp.]
MGIGALVLAAGKGSRMHSSRPKVLHEILGEPMLRHVLRAVAQLSDDQLVVLGHCAEKVQSQLLLPDSAVVWQGEQLGTGHAVQCAWPEIQKRSWRLCLVVNGDAPLLEPSVIQALLHEVYSTGAALGFLTLEPEDPSGYGRVIRTPQGGVQAIVEAKDYSALHHGTEAKEVNAGVYALDVNQIGPLLGKLSNSNQQNEYYLTDLVEMAVHSEKQVIALQAGRDTSLLGVNTPQELTACEELLRRRLVHYWQQQGVIIRSAEQVRIGADVEMAPGAEIIGPCSVTGQSSLASQALVSEYCWVHDTQVGPKSIIYPYSHLEQAIIDSECAVGPYARLRRGTHLHPGAKVGNFVETKQAVLGRESKANHLSYLGDCELGEAVNVGAGTITCNYDGHSKHRTVIEDGVFVGSNTALVAPVRIGKDALLGAGSTITRDVPAQTLAVARVRQKHLALKRKVPPHDNG